MACNNNYWFNNCFINPKSWLIAGLVLHAGCGDGSDINELDMTITRRQLEICILDNKVLQTELTNCCYEAENKEENAE